MNSTRDPQLLGDSCALTLQDQGRAMEIMVVVEL